MATREKAERKAARDANTRFSRSTRNEGVELFMECEEEELSPSQIAAHKQAEKEYLEAIQKINALKSNNGQIIQSHQNSSSPTLMNHTKLPPSPSSSPLVNNFSTSDSATVQNQPLVHAQTSPQVSAPIQSFPGPLIGLPRVAVPISQPQQFIIQNTLPVPAAQPPATAYKLLLDTRTGLILGTVPNDGQAIIATSGTSPSSGSQNPTVTLVPSHGNSASLPQILSVTGTNTTLQGKLTVVSSSPQLTAKQQISLQTGTPQILNIKSVSPEHKNKNDDFTQVKKIDSSEKPASAMNANENNLLSSADDSLTGADVNNRIPSQYPSLTVKIVPQRLAALSVIVRKRMDLEKTMKEVLCQSMSNLVKWMFEHGLFHINQKCLVHRNNPMHLVFDAKNEHDRSGGYKWQCSLCQCVLPIQHRSFFDSLGYGFVTMLKVIYCWACNEDVQKVLQQTKVDACFLRSVYSLLRTICSTKVKLLMKLGGNESRPVEVSMSMLNISCSNCMHLYIGCIFERVTGLVALRAFDSRNDSKFHDFIQEFVLPSSIITIERELKICPALVKEQSYKIITSPRGSCNTDPGSLIINAIAYVQERVIPMLGSVITQLRIETVQSFLNELMWREKFGTNPYNAFNNILLHIKQHYGTGASLLRTNSQPIQMPVVTVVSVDTEKDIPSALKKTDNSRTLQMRRKRDSRSEDDGPLAKKMVRLDDYYYAWQEGSRKVDTHNEKITSKFKCHVCKKMFDNNIKVMRHLYAHIENSKQRNLDLSDLTQCKYCFREFETPYIMQCHVEDVHLKDSNSLTCRICDRAFKDKTNLINHMCLTHTASEMPYSCEVCHYRCSMYRKIIEHFQLEHSGTNYVQCHYCLRVYNIKCSSVQQIGFTNNFWMHIYKHQTKSLSRKCTACCLTFFGQNEMKQHRLHDHVSYKDRPGVKKYPVDASKEILIMEPSKEKGRVPKTKLLKASGSNTGRENLRPYHSVESLIEIQTNDVEGMRCLECKSEIELPDHFLKFVGCSLCRYATNCGKAFANHMIYRHSKIRRDDHSWPVYLPKRMYCICGFYHSRGNCMAYHLVQCGKRSCYPSSEKAKRAILQPTEDEQPSPNSGEYDFQTTNLISDKETNNEEIIEKKEENPNMLNILGLMRKPGGNRWNDTTSTNNMVTNDDTKTSEPVPIQIQEQDECNLKADENRIGGKEIFDTNGPDSDHDAESVNNIPSFKEVNEDESCKMELEQNSLVEEKPAKRQNEQVKEIVKKQANRNRNRRRKRKWRFGNDWTRRKGIRRRRAPVLREHLVHTILPQVDDEKVLDNKNGVENHVICPSTPNDVSSNKDEENDENNAANSEENTNQSGIEESTDEICITPDILVKEDQPMLISCIANVDNISVKDDEALPPELDCYAETNEK